MKRADGTHLRWTVNRKAVQSIVAEPAADRNAPDTPLAGGHEDGSLFALDNDELWDSSGQRWVQEGPVTGKPWCASSLRYFDDQERYEVSCWMQLGWWEKPNIFEMRKASHKAALKQLFEDWDGDMEALFPDVIGNALWKLRSFGT